MSKKKTHKKKVEDVIDGANHKSDVATGNGHKNPNSKHIYFALDSDVITNLADALELRETYPECTQTELREMVDIKTQGPLHKNFNFYMRLLDAAEEDKIRFLVTTTPLCESVRVPRLKSFIQRKCYIPNISGFAVAKKMAAEAEKLAFAYCEGYEKDGKYFHSPYSLHFNSYAGKDVPENDVYALAEAATCGAVFLTENAKHLIYKEEKRNGLGTYKPKNVDRARGVEDINMILGYYSELIDDEGNPKKVPYRPYTIEQIGPSILYFKHKQNLTPKSLDSSFRKPEDSDFEFMAR